MAKRPPKLVALDHDDYSARHVGRTADGRQFFLTRPFVPAPGHEYLALYLFDAAGRLTGLRVEDLGPRARLDRERTQALRAEWLAALGEVTFGRIEVAPFRVEVFGVEFGFIAHPPEPGFDKWQVTVEPGNYMAFRAPWNRGVYDT